MEVADKIATVLNVSMNDIIFRAESTKRRIKRRNRMEKDVNLLEEWRNLNDLKTIFISWMDFSRVSYLF